MSKRNRGPLQPKSIDPENKKVEGLSLYRGKLLRFECNDKDTFYLSDLNPDLKLIQREAQILSVLSALAGNSGAAAGEAIRSRESNEMEAHYVRFFIDGIFFSGSLGFAPFLEGDEVEVVAGPGEEPDMKKVFAIRRVSDGLITTTPTCNAGRRGYYLNMFYVWLVIIFICNTVPFFHLLAGDGFNKVFFIFASKITLGISAFLGLITLGMCSSVASNSPQNIIAEHIFSAFGWKNPHAIILRGPRRYKNIIAGLPLAERFKAKQYRSDYNWSVFVYPRR